MGTERRGVEETFRFCGSLDGAVTVFFALSVSIICALLLSVAESARTQSARLYLTQAVNASVDSLFSQYHQPLWEKYRLLGLEHYSDEQLQKEMEEFLSPYLEAKNWYPMKIEAAEISKKQCLTDEDGKLFEEEVLAYMKYGIAASVMEGSLAEVFLQQLREANAVDEIAAQYQKHSKTAVKLEKALERIDACLQEQEVAISAAIEAAARQNGREAEAEIRKAQQALQKLPEQVQRYERTADALRGELERSRAAFEKRHQEGALSDQVYVGLDADIAAYESYVKEDGARRQEITAFPGLAAAESAYLDGVMEEIDAIQELIDSWEPEDEEDELDEDALWQPVEKALERCPLIRLTGAHGIADPEKETLLEQLSLLLQGKFLELLLPKGEQPSGKVLPLAECPSKTSYKGGDHCRLNLMDRIFVAEYLTKTMHYYGRDRYGQNPEKKGSGALELEYILQGKDNDLENLTATVRELIGIRSGLNLVYLYGDSEKRAEARALAQTVTGVLGFTPLISVVTFFVLGVWALGQGFCDVRDLLHGRSVPLMHTAQSFYLDLGGLLEIGKTGRLKELENNAETGRGGLSYELYLKLLLLATQGVQQDYRSMDVMQMAIRTDQEDFLLSRCAYGLEMNVTVQAGRLFTRLGITGAGGRLGLVGSYRMRVSTAYSY